MLVYQRVTIKSPSSKITIRQKGHLRVQRCQCPLVPLGSSAPGGFSTMMMIQNDPSMGKSWENDGKIMGKSWENDPSKPFFWTVFLGKKNQTKPQFRIYSSWPWHIIGSIADGQCDRRRFHGVANELHQFSLSTPPYTMGILWEYIYTYT